MFAGVGYLLPAVGSTGISLSVYVANHRRHPKSNGIQIEFKRIIGETEVMKSTYAVGKEYPRLGNAILRVFFPGTAAIKGYSATSLNFGTPKLL